MPEKLRAIVVDDDDIWANILEDALTPGFATERAKSISDVSKLLENTERRIEIALVDIRLKETDAENAAGLAVIDMLNQLEIPCIAVTAYENQKAVRDALMSAGAKDVWFKVDDNRLSLRKKIETTISRAKKKRSAQKRTFISPFFQPVEVEADMNLVFVIMPFTEIWSSETLTVIKSAAEKFKLNIVRADDIFASQSIINDIWQLMNQAGLIIADITIPNANVYYELGIAHTLGKKVVLIRQPHGEKPPFDISGLRYFEYELTRSKAEEFKDRLSKVFERYLKKT